MNNSELADLLRKCADIIQEYRNSPLEISSLTYDRLKAVELNAREAAREAEQAEDEWQPIETERRTIYRA